ncbi:MAG: tRNA adenosine(34) deaminase TadA [Leptolyngbyaceae cyanobacterium bins.59]|nr:tRNA adenosine(34) deaminase TadA [Leptolyngbyaceae cyanobacterium bins.59]
MIPAIPPPAFDDSEYLTHYRWMQQAIELADEAGLAGEIPVGAVIVGPDGGVLAEGNNRRERDHDPTAHAEIVAIRAASQVLQNWHLNDCTLYVTLEPCPMCAGAILQSRISLLVYGTDDPKTGAIRSALNLPDSPCSYHYLSVVSGVLGEPCRDQLQAWFAQRRQQKQQQRQLG